MSNEINEYRRYLSEDIIRTCIRMQKDGINQGTSGNVSFRFENGMLITPSSMPYDTMKAEDIVFVDENGKAEEGKRPSSEWRFHLSILKDNPDFNCVIHSHSIYSTIVSIMGVDYIPAIHYMVAVAGGKIIPCAEYATYGTEELCNNISKAMKGYKACIIKNHGLVVSDSSMEKAYGVLVEVENLAREFVEVSKIGKYNILSDEEMDIILKKFGNYGLNARK